MPVSSILKIVITLMIGLVVIAPTAVKADALDDALRSGAVGETTRGYIAAVNAPDAALTRLINDINSRRRAKYLDIARKNNMSLPQIEAVAGKRIIERAAAGTFYKDDSGRWRRK